MIRAGKHFNLWKVLSLIWSNITKSYLIIKFQNRLLVFSAKLEIDYFNNGIMSILFNYPSDNGNRTARLIFAAMKIITIVFLRTIFEESASNSKAKTTKTGNIVMKKLTVILLNLLESRIY